MDVNDHNGIGILAFSLDDVIDIFEGTTVYERLIKDNKGSGKPLTRKKLNELYNDIAKNGGTPDYYYSRYPHRKEK